MASRSIKVSGYVIFSPITFIVIFCISFFLYTLQLSRSIAAVHIETVIYVFLSIAMFFLGIFYAHVRNKNKTDRTDMHTNHRALWPVFFFCVSLYLIEYVYFVIRFGNIPVLLPNFENLRFQFPINGYIHLIAMASRTSLIYMYAYFSRYGLPKSQRILLFSCIFLVVMLDLLQGVRGAALFFIFSLFVIRSFYKKVGAKFIYFAVFALIFIGLMKTWREYAIYGMSSITSVERDSKLPGGIIGVSLYHLYMAFAFNFSMLNEYVLHMKEQFYGYFTFFYGIVSLAPGRQYDLVDLQRDVLNRNFFAPLTSTMLSYPYFDFGMFGALISGLIGWIMQSLYFSAKETKSIKYVATYAYCSINMFLGIYTYTFSEIYVQANIFLLIVVFPKICARRGMRPRNRMLHRQVLGNRR